MFTGLCENTEISDTDHGYGRFRQVHVANMDESIFGDGINLDDLLLESHADLYGERVPVAGVPVDRQGDHAFNLRATQYRLMKEETVQWKFCVKKNQQFFDIC